MVRNTAREIAAHLSYELSFTDKTVEELLHERLTAFGLLGAVLIFGSALVSELGGKKRRQNTAA